MQYLALAEKTKARLMGLNSPGHGDMARMRFVCLCFVVGKPTVLTEDRQWCNVTKNNFEVFVLYLTISNVQYFYFYFTSRIQISYFYATTFI